MTITMTLDGTALTSSVPNVRVLDVDRQLAGAVRDVHVEVPGRDGAWTFAEARGDRLITVRCAVLDGSMATVRTSVRSVAAWARKTARTKLIFSDESDRYWWAILADTSEVSEVRGVAQFVLTFRCDPYAYSTSVTTQGPQSLTDNVAWTFTPSDGVPASPEVAITSTPGIVGGFTLTVNGKSLTRPANVTAGQTITVSSISATIITGASTDTELVGVYVPANVSMANVTGDFGSIIAGLNSVTVNTADGSSVSATVKWRRRYD